MACCLHSMTEHVYKGFGRFYILLPSLAASRCFTYLPTDWRTVFAFINASLNHKGYIYIYTYIFLKKGYIYLPRLYLYAAVLRLCQGTLPRGRFDKEQTICHAGEPRYAYTCTILEPRWKPTLQPTCTRNIETKYLTSQHVTTTKHHDSFISAPWSVTGQHMFRFRILRGCTQTHKKDHWSLVTLWRWNLIVLWATVLRDQEGYTSFGKTYFYGFPGLVFEVAACGQEKKASEVLALDRWCKMDTWHRWRSLQPPPQLLMLLACAVPAVLFVFVWVSLCKLRIAFSKSAWM